MIKNNIAIFGVPRSGTSWTGQIFNSSPSVAYRFQPLFSYEFKDRINESSSKAKIEKFYEDLLNAKSDFVLQKTIISGAKGINFPKVEPETLVWKEVHYLNLVETLLERQSIKVLLITRHPCAVINSWLSTPKEFDKSWDPYKEWRTAKQKNQNKKENYFGYEKWKEATRLFVELEKKYPEQAKIIKYEDLNNETMATTQTMFNFAGLELESQTEDFIKISKTTHDNDPYGIFRRKQDAEKWKNELDKQIIDELLSDLKTFKPASALGYI